MMDPSYGWEAAANAFIAARSPITGASTVRTWAHALPPGSSILDVGCGFGVPIAEALMRDGHVVFGVDASPTLVDAFRKRFPDATVVCESAQKSAFFNRTFDGVVAIGLVFLLPAAVQRRLLRKLARAVKPGGRLLFTSPQDACSWTDVLTGQTSVSLGSDEYEDILASEMMSIDGGFTDEGKNYYYSAVKRLGKTEPPAAVDRGGD